jgi:hypothetical protein
VRYVTEKWFVVALCEIGSDPDLIFTDDVGNMLDPLDDVFDRRISASLQERWKQSHSHEAPFLRHCAKFLVGLVPRMSLRSSIYANGRTTNPRLRRSGSTCKNVPENDGFVMQLVASRKDEREGIVSRDRPKLAEELSSMGELSLVSPAELDPSARVMPEPPA